MKLIAVLFLLCSGLVALAAPAKPGTYFGMTDDLFVTIRLKEGPDRTLVGAGDIRTQVESGSFETVGHITGNYSITNNEFKGYLTEDKVEVDGSFVSDNVLEIHMLSVRGKEKKRIVFRCIRYYDPGDPKDAWGLVEVIGDPDHIAVNDVRTAPNGNVYYTERRPGVRGSTATSRATPRRQRGPS
jgi:hypothetical protein